MASIQVGQRVVRSDTWTWRDQDGGTGHMGTVVRVGNDDLPEGLGIPRGWVKIRWDNGYSNNYQAGAKDCYDLLLLDNAPAGVVHKGIVCDGCSETPLAGMRWKCCDQSCPDLDLCTTCYMTDKHDITHTFTRFVSRSETGTQISHRVGDTKTTSRGLCPGAVVTRGKNLLGGGGEINVSTEGRIVRMADLPGHPRSAAEVNWSQSGTVTTHKVGCDGKVEIQFKEAGTDIAYYARHLPLLGKDVGLKTGDSVAITLDAETLEAMQRTSGRGWQDGMGKLFAKVGRVCGVTLKGDVEVVYPDGKAFTLHPEVLAKIPNFEVGDRVRINKDSSHVKSLQENSNNGWVDGMEKCLGLEGEVTNVDSNKNAKVNLIGLKRLWSWHPCSLTLVRKNPTEGKGGGGGGGVEAGIETGGEEFLLKALLSLLQKGGDDSSEDDDEGDAHGEDVGVQLVQAAKKGNIERVVEILSVSPEKVNSKVKGTSGLHHASAMGHQEVVQALLGAGAEIEIMTDDQNTPLHYAIEGDEPAIAKLLIEKGAAVNGVNKTGRRAIHRAAYKGHVDCTRVLIRQNCDVNVQDLAGDTPLHDAIDKNHLEVIELLLEVPGIDLALANQRELTPLQFAAFKDRPGAAELIVQAFPRSIIIPREDGHTVLHICAVNNHVECIKVILADEDHGLCLDAKNEEGLTALHLAAAKGQTDCIEYLVGKGADMNCQSNDGHTSLHLVANARGRDVSRIDDSPNLKKIRQRYRDGSVNDTGAALLCFMVLQGAKLDIENDKCRTPLSYVKDQKLRQTLKKIAGGDKIDDMASWEDLGEDEDVKGGRLSSNVMDEDNDVIVKRNDSLGFPIARSQRPKVEVFDLVHEINTSDLEMGPVIGKGQFGVVHRASWRGTPVAVKKISITGSRREEVEKEVAIHRRASHPNIVQMMALGYEGIEAFLVMQLIEGKSLSAIIFPDVSDTKVSLDAAQKLQISREILQAVTYMHACDILHLDIKPANILVETITTRPYLCDMGLAHIKNRNLMSQSSMNMRGTPCFMPPEALDPTAQDRRHSDKHDVWSVAGTLVEFHAMKRLWGDSISPFVLMARFATGKIGKPASLASVESRVRSILEPCFNKDPASRPKAHTLLDKFNALT